MFSDISYHHKILMSSFITCREMHVLLGIQVFRIRPSDDITISIARPYDSPQLYVCIGMNRWIFTNTNFPSE